MPLLLDDSTAGVVVAQVVGGDGAQGTHQFDGQLVLDVLETFLQQPWQVVDPVDDDRPDPGQVVEADVVQEHTFRSDPEAPGQSPLEVDGHVAQADGAMAPVEQRLGDDADGIGEVDQPGIRRRLASDQLRELQHDGHRPKCLGEAPGSGRLLADAVEPKGQRLVQHPGGLATDAQLDQHECRAVHGRDRVRRLGDPDRRPSTGQHPAGEPRHDGQPLGRGIQQDQLVDRQDVRATCDALDELRRVRATAADDRDLESHAPVSCSTRSDQGLAFPTSL